MAPLVARFSETRFVLLSGACDSDLMLKAMEVGARHLLLKSAIKDDLAAVLGRLLSLGGNGSSGDGAIITVLSGSGGCGATTLAFNLANELALASERPSLLIDLDRYYGAIAPYLGLKGRYGIGDLLSRDGHIDGELLQSTTVPFAENLHVLLSPVSTAVPSSKPVSHRNMDKILCACKQSYAHTVIDAPRALHEMVATLAAASSSVLLVFQMTVKDVHVIRAERARLLERGIPDTRIILVGNRYDKRSSVTPDEARAVLGHQPLHLIANDYRTAVDCVNFGRPLSKAAPSSPLRRDIRQLIDALDLVPPQKVVHQASRIAALW
jgi:pilus assembly protein CpaE